MTTALVSALTGIPVRRDVAMTGEISLRGKVLAIGGLKEKTMAAYTHHIRTVILPKENEPDIDELSLEVRNGLRFVPVTHVDEVLPLALCHMPCAEREETAAQKASQPMHVPHESGVRSTPRA